MATASTTTAGAAPSGASSAATATAAAEFCMQWQRGKCRRGAACRYAHAEIAVPERRPEQCSYVAGWKRCQNLHSGTQDGLLVCSEHTTAAMAEKRAVSSANLARKRARDDGDEGAAGGGEAGAGVGVPARAVKRVSAKSRMLNPDSVRVAVRVLDPADFEDAAAPMVVDVGAARGKFLLQLAAHDVGAGVRRNYVGFELRSTLVAAAAEASAAAGLGTRLGYVEGDASVGAVEASLARMPPGVVQWLCVQFPDPWTKKKHLKRRVVSKDFVDSAHRLLAPGGRLYLCSDRKDLVEDMYDVVVAAGGWTPEGTVVEEPEAGEAQGGGAPAAADTRSTPRVLVPDRVFPVGTERDAVAEKTARPVTRAVFVRGA